MSSLDLTAQMSANFPFSLIEDETGSLMKDQMLNLKTGESVHIGISFDTSFKNNLHNEVINGLLTICYTEHQHNDLINLTGEIYFPNLLIETNKIDFGCILNNTEVSQSIKMTNIGPLIVNYKWKFISEKDNVVSNLPILSSNSIQTNNEAQSVQLDLDTEGINQEQQENEDLNQLESESQSLQSHRSFDIENSQLKKTVIN